MPIKSPRKREKLEQPNVRTVSIPHATTWFMWAADPRAFARSWLRVLMISSLPLFCGLTFLSPTMPVFAGPPPEEEPQPDPDDPEDPKDPDPDPPSPDDCFGPPDQVVPAGGSCDDGEFCTIDYCVDGKCDHVNNDGAQCESDNNVCTDDICQGGQCTHDPVGWPKPCIDSDENPCTRGVCEGYFCVSVPTNNGGSCEDEDGNPCTPDECWDGVCRHGYEEVCPHHSESGIIWCSACVEDNPWGLQLEIPPQRRLWMNNDDDNGNGVADSEEFGVQGEDDLFQASFDIGGEGLGCECITCQGNCSVFQTQCFWSYELPQSILSCAGELLCDSDNTTFVNYYWSLCLDQQCDIALEQRSLDEFAGHPFPEPATVFIQGGRMTDSCGTSADIWARRQIPICHYRTEPIVIYGVDSLEWEPYLDNLYLGNCPNNGGQRIFPGKLSPDDDAPLDRRQVRLVATVSPPIPGVEVYFRIFDVDDPFDQLHGPNAADPDPNTPENEAFIENVEILDDTPTSGPDNRGNNSAVGLYGPVETDECGKAAITVEVSLRPGDNYRAAASVIEEALYQDTMHNEQPVTPQEHADALSVEADENGAWTKNGNFSGYSCPREWSPMLTVWRKLHVEVDSMGPVNWTATLPETSNAQNGEIPEAPTFDAATGTAWIPIEELHADFATTDQHRVGKIYILNYGDFSTDRTDISEMPHKVRIRNAPANIVNASGLAYTLWDDDIGSDATANPPFVMVGFDAPPVALPKVPDTSLMAEVYKDAYVDVPAPDMQYYDSNTPFDRNVRNNSGAITKGNANRNLTSAADLWVVHITSAFQGFVSKDNDPDTEQASPDGLQFGLTIEQGVWPFPIHSSGSLIWLETIRDHSRGSPAQMQELERYTVAHESGHQFLLQHSDGYAPPEGPTGDYIMTDDTDQTGMAPNVAFSPASLKKIRKIDYPPQP